VPTLSGRLGRPWQSCCNYGSLIDDALHRLDFVESMLARPVRDGLMWLTLLGISLSVVSGGRHRAAPGLRRFTWPAKNRSRWPA